MYGIFKPGGFQLIPDKYISLVSVRHDTLQFRVAQEVCKHLTAPGAILIEENSRFLSLVDQYPNIILIAVISYADRAVIAAF